MRKENVSTILTVKLVVSFGVVATIIILAASIAFYSANDDTRTLLTFIVTSIAAAGQLGAAIYTARILQFTVDTQNKSSADLSEKEARVEQQLLEDAASRYGSRWVDPSMYHTRKECLSVIENRNSPQDVKRSLQEKEDKATNMRNALNFLEDMALSVNSGRCDEKIAKDLFCGIVLNIWHATGDWVQAERVRLGRTQAYIQIEVLFNRWK